MTPNCCSNHESGWRRNQHYHGSTGTGQKFTVSNIVAVPLLPHTLHMHAISLSVHPIINMYRSKGRGRLGMEVTLVTFCLRKEIAGTELCHSLPYSIWMLEAIVLSLDHIQRMRISAPLSPLEIKPSIHTYIGYQ